MRFPASIRLIAFFACSLATFGACAQPHTKTITGKYVERYGATELSLFPDSTFTLLTPDQVFAYTYKNYKNRGKWTVEGNEVRLNPHLQKRVPVVKMTSGFLPESSDSITVKVNYSLETYRHDILVVKERADFKMLTLFWNSPHQYRTLVRQRVVRNCSFARRIKNQLVVDTSNTVRLAKTQLDWLGVTSYGFDEIARLPVTDPRANYFVIDVLLPVDEERTPRDQPIVIKGKKAYYWGWDGKVSTSIFAPTLKRVAG